MSDAAVWPRLLAAICALAAGAAAIAVVVVLGHRTPGPAPSSAPAAAPAAQPPPAAAPRNAFPAPPEGAVVFSRQDDADILALAVTPGRTLGLQASIVNGQGQGARGRNVWFGVDGATHPAGACGAGCYRAAARSAAAPRRVVVHVTNARGGVTTWPVELPRPWPPPDASAIVARATRTFESLRSFTVADRLASDAQHAVFTRWQIVGPDRLAYRIVGGAAAVIIGDRRWDKVPGGTWQPARQTPIHQPTPFWSSWKDAHVLASTPTTWRVSFYDPKTPGWYELVIAKPTLRPLEMRMNATAHFMHDVYGGFNTPIRIVPPVAR